MFDDETKDAFRKRVRGASDWIETIIQAFYEALSETSPGSIMVDGGAHVGRHTLPMAALPNVSKVVAVEANDETFSRLAKRLQDLPVAAKVWLVHGALQDDQSRAEVPFIKSSSHPGRSGINPVLRGNPKTVFGDPLSQPATTIDLLTSGDSCRFIKLDLEGGEFAALRGAAECLRRHRPAVVFENGKDAPEQNGYTIDQFVRHMTDLNYDVRTIFCEPMTAANAADFWYAWATPVEQRDITVALMRAIVDRKLADPPAPV